MLLFQLLQVIFVDADLALAKQREYLVFIKKYRDFKMIMLKAGSVRI